MQEEHKVEAYPVPRTVDAIDIDDNFRFNKSHFVINPKYTVYL